MSERKGTSNYYALVRSLEKLVEQGAMEPVEVREAFLVATKKRLMAWIKLTKKGARVRYVDHYGEFHEVGFDEFVKSFRAPSTRAWVAKLAFKALMAEIAKRKK